MINKNKPRLKIVIGRVKTVITGFTSKLTTPSSKAAQKPAQSPLIVIPGMIADVINKVSIVINNFVTSFPNLLNLQLNII